VAGVDMLETNDGPQILEVNSSPGLEGIEEATGLDIAGEIVSYLESRTKFPDLDIRFRLSASRGYGVVELPIVKGSSLAGKSLGDLALRERDVLVLSIAHGGSSVPNPDAESIVQEGDVLLCYGKLEALHALMPADHPQRRRKKKKKRSTKAAAAKG
jgi:ribosomal protein S6--L-glutamate ligase